MKKFTVLCLAGLLVLAFGAAASAQEVKLDFRASGSIDAQTHLSVNVQPLQGARATSAYDILGGDYKTFSAAGKPLNAINKKSQLLGFAYEPQIRSEHGKGALRSSPVRDRLHSMG